MKSPFAKMNPWSKDRNDQARLSEAHQQFAGQVRAGHVGAKDRFGNAMQVGSLIVWKPELETVWEVVAVRPILDPSKPPGFVQIEVRAAGQFHALANNLQPHVIVIGAREPTEDERRIADGIAPADEPDPRD